jgi:GNAT superfamily N-acetyltransferase
MPDRDVPLTIRRAGRDDLAPIVRLLADDALGAARETTTTPLLDTYTAAFDAIDGDPHHELVVADLGSRRTIAVLQLTVMPGLTHRGMWRAQIEGVRVASDLRASGIGGELIAWAIARARERGCRMVQLMSDKRRPDAIRFYERLGFVASHEGLKLHLG